MRQHGESELPVTASMRQLTYAGSGAVGQGFLRPAQRNCRPIQLAAPVARGGGRFHYWWVRLRQIRARVYAARRRDASSRLLNHALGQTCISIDRFGLSRRYLAFPLIEE